jgi:hypothetical protein
MPTWTGRVGGALAVGILLLAGCEGELSPVEVVQSFMTAVETLDTTEVEALVCQSAKAKVRESLAPFRSIARPETFDIDLKDLVFQEQSNNGEVAVVHVSGELTLVFLGQQETREINENHTVIKESGRWLVCDP